MTRSASSRRGANLDMPDSMRLNMQPWVLQTFADFTPGRRCFQLACRPQPMPPPLGLQSQLFQELFRTHKGAHVCAAEANNMVFYGAAPAPSSCREAALAAAKQSNCLSAQLQGLEGQGAAVWCWKIVRDRLGGGPRHQEAFESGTGQDTCAALKMPLLFCFSMSRCGAGLHLGDSPAI